MRTPLLLLLLGCSQPASPRLPTLSEASPEVVVANYAPPRLRIVPDRSSEGAARYLIIGTEMPELIASWRPLAVVDRPPPVEFLPRAGDFAWVAGHIILGLGGPAPAIEVYDRDGRRPARVPLRPLGPCTAEGPPLLIGEGDVLHGVLSCPKERRSYVFSTDGAGVLQRQREVPLVAQIFRRGGGADYLLGQGALLRLGGQGDIVRVPLPGLHDGAETRDLLISSHEALVIDGAGGELRLWRIGLAAPGKPSPARRFSLFAVVRLRAALAGDHVMLVLARRLGSGSQILGVSLPLDGRGPAAPLLLGSGPRDSDHDLVPVAEAKGAPRALLVRTHPGNTGPQVSLSKLSF